jgi:hypothetical protein
MLRLAWDCVLPAIETTCSLNICIHFMTPQSTAGPHFNQPIPLGSCCAVALLMCGAESCCAVPCCAVLCPCRCQAHTLLQIWQRTTAPGRPTSSKWGLASTSACCVKANCMATEWSAQAENTCSFPPTEGLASEPFSYSECSQC